MAYKQKGCSPITAKLKRTTKGGMVQDPLLNVGSVLKMSSPAKQGGRNRGLSKEERDKRNYSKNKKQYLEDTKYMKDNPASPYVQNYLDKGGRGDIFSSYDRAYKRTKEFEKNLYDYDKKNKPGEVTGFKTAADYAKFKTTKTDTTKTDTTKTDTTKTNKARSEGEAGWAADDAARKNKTNQYAPKTTKRTSYDTAYKNRDMKTYGKMSKADYIKEAKRQNASKKAGKGWDVKNKTKAVQTRPIAKTVGAKTVQINTPNTKLVETKPKVEEISKAKANKLSRAARVRAKGEAALASGDKKKALRLKRREERIKKRAAKK